MFYSRTPLVFSTLGYNSSFSVTANNPVFQRELATWQNISSRVYLWDYTANFLDLGFLSPYPAWASIVPNMRAFKAAGIRGYYAEGPHSPPTRGHAHTPPGTGGPP